MYKSTQIGALASFFITSRGTRWMLLFLLLSFIGSNVPLAQAQSVPVFCGHSTAGPGGALSFTTSFQTVTAPADSRSYWPFSATVGTLYSFSNCGGSGNTIILRIYDAVGNLVAQNDDDDGPYCFNGKASLDFMPTNTGTYYVHLSKYSQGFIFDISPDPIIVPDDFCALLNYDEPLAYKAEIFPAPTISSLSPTGGLAGTNVTLTGTNFSHANGVSFNGTAAISVRVSSPTTATATVPVGATTGPVTISTPGGGPSNGVLFTVPPSPVITALSPERNQLNVPRAASVAVSFDQTLSPATAGGLRVFSQQRGGLMSGSQGGAATVSGSTLTFDPATDFRPGETIYTTLIRGVQGSNGASMVRPWVQQFTAAAGVGPGSFSGGSDIDLFASGPYSVAIGDVDGDGDLDLVTANYLNSTVSVMLNNGSGAFSYGQAIGVQLRPTSIVLGDVDGDGDLDLITANLSADAANVLLNNGSGNFSGGPGLQPFVGPSPTSIVLGDMDGDGALDLLTTNAGNNTVSVRVNNGTGFFGRGLDGFGGINPLSSDVSVGRNPESVAVGDVNGDGYLDFVTANRGDGTVSVRLNKGNGSAAFDFGSEVSVGASPLSVALGDVDGDGDLDLLTANAGTNTVSVRLNNGSGVFSGGSEVNVGASPQSVALGDVDGDGDLDLVTANFGAEAASVRLNNGSGVFSGGSDPVVDYASRSVALGDLVGDGALDLVTANSLREMSVNGTSFSTLSVRLNQPTGPALRSFSPSSGPVGTVVTLTGNLFTGAIGVSFNGTPATSFAVTSPTTATATVPAGSSTGAVSVANPAGVATSTLTPVLRLQAAVGSDNTVYLDQVVLLGGSRFFRTRVDNGSFEGGAPAGDLTTPTTEVYYWSFGGGARLSTTASAFAPPAPPDGSAHVVVLTNAGGYVEQALDLVAGTYRVRFRLAQRQCCTTPYTQAVQVLINGLNLGAALTTTSAGYVEVTSEPFTVSNAGIFTVLAPPTPTLSSLSPTSGVAGTSVTLTGTNFTGATGISFNGTPATTFSVTNATTATAIVPAGTTTGNVTITTPGGISNGVAFTVVTPTTVTSIVPAGSSPTNATSVVFTVTFSQAVSGVTTDDFAVVLPASGLTGSVTGVSAASGTSIDVTVSSIAGNGVLGLNLNSSGTGITDGAGNAISGGFTGQTYTVDQSAPTVLNSVRKLPSAEATNINTVTYTVTFSESVTGVVGTDFSLTVTGGVTGTIGTVTGSGITYDVQVNGITGDGTLRLDVKASGTGVIDGARNGLSGGFATGQTYTFDHTAPSVVSINRQDPSDAATTAAILTYRVTFSEAVSGVGIDDFSLTVTSPATGNIASIEVVSPLVYDVTVNVTNAGGGTLRLDLNSSGTGIADLVSNPVSGGFTSGQIYTLGIPPSITGCPATAQTFNPGQGLCYATITKTTLLTGLTINGAPIPTVTVWVGTTEVTGSYNFQVGNTTVTVKAANGIGTDATCTFTVTVTDDQDPSITAPSAITAQPADAGACGAAKANVNLGTPTTGDNCGVRSTTNNAPATFPVGTTTVTWTVTDVNGRTNTATQSVTVIDNQNPSITAPADITSQPADANMCGAAKANVNLGTPTTGDNCGVQSTINNAPATFPVGTTTVTWTVTDVNGRTNTATQSVTVIDNQDPSITAPAAITSQPADANTCGAAKANVNLGTPTTGDNCGVQSTTNNAPATFPVGITTVTWTVTDVNGRTKTATQNVTVIDNQDPSITAPAAITAQPADANTCGAAKANVNLGTPTTDDNCGVQGTTNNAPATFPVGTTTVTWTVTDVNGRTNTATQSVTVIDNQKPVIAAVSAITANTDAGVCGATVAITAPAATDNCTVGTPIGTRDDGAALGAVFPVGTTTITWNVSDANGNAAVAVTQTVTVIDNQKPTISTITQNVYVLWPANHKMREVALNYTVGDNCPTGITYAVTVTSNEPTNGTGDGDTDIDWEIVNNHLVRLRAERAAQGNGRIYTVTVTATDGAGLVTTKSINVVVSHNIVSPVSGRAVKVGSIVSFSGTFWDKPGNKHTATWTLDGNTTVKATLVEPSGLKNGTVAGAYKFTSPGVYKLRMNVKDQTGMTTSVNTAGDLEAIVVVYDPNAGYTVGGGWFSSPAGALPANPGATGKVSYGFQSNYYKGATNPKGETQFEFKSGEFEFNALNFEYLAVSGARAQFKGSGNIVGDRSGYSFIMTVIDGDAPGGGGVDKIRMKIFNKNTGAIIYDNQPGASDAADPITPVGSGSTITITGGNVSTSASFAPATKEIALDVEEIKVPEKLQARAFPNPTSNYFRLVLQSRRTEQVNLRVVDLVGSVVEAKRGIAANSTLRIGDNYRPGIYFVEVTQGKEKVVMKLVKQSE